MNVTEAIRTRRAVRQYQDTPLPAQAMHAILNAGRRSQSSKNTQPWQYIAITNKNDPKSLFRMRRLCCSFGRVGLGVALLMPDPAEHFQVLFDIGHGRISSSQPGSWGLDRVLPPSTNRRKLAGSWVIRLTCACVCPCLSATR